MLDEHVEITSGAEGRAEPTELGAQLVAPLLIHEWPRGPQKCSRPARGDPHLVEILRVAAETRARVVRHQLRALLPQARR